MKTFVGGMVGLAVAYKGLRLAVSSVKEFAAFETQLANISTMLDDQTMDFLPGYKAQLASLAVEFGQTTETLSKGLYDILSASVGAADAVSVLRVASKAAIGGLTTTAVAADALTTVMNAYGMEAADATKVSDILFATVKGGKLTFAELGSSIGKVVAIAATAGLSLEEVSASIATMTRMGINADMAMTALKAMLTGFVSPTKEAIAAAKIFGLELSSNTLRTIGMTGAMQLLANATVEETAAIFPNVRALLGSEATRKNVVALIGDHTKALNAAGLAEIAYRKNAATTEIALAKNRELWIGIKRDLGEGIAPQVNTWLQGMSLLAKEWKSGWTSMVNVQKSAQAEINAQLEEPDIITKFNLSRKKEADDLVNAAKEFAEIQKSVMKDIAEKEFVGPMQTPTADTDTDTGSAEEAKRTAGEETEAYRRLYDDLGSMNIDSYNNRLKLLDMEREDYARFIDDKVLLDEWYNERKKELDLERATAGDSFQAGFTESIAKMNADQMTLGEVGAKTAQTMQASFGTAMKSMIQDGATWKEALHGFAQSMLSSFIDIITQMIAMKIMASAFGVGGGVSSFVGPPAPNAKGNIFSNGSIVPFAKGTVLSGPTIFPMSNGGVGLAGEAGSEAIMPLGRDNQGRLGVRTDGDGESSKTPIKIINVMDYSMVQEYLSSGDGERMVVNIMRRNGGEIQGSVG